MGLPSNHRRILSVTSEKTESSIISMERILTGKETDRKTQKLIPAYEEEKRQKILKLLDRLRVENEKFFEEFKLKPVEKYEDRLIKSQVSYLWTVLIDSKAKRLANYGAVDEKSGEKIDERIDSLLAIIKEITNELV